MRVQILVGDCRRLLQGMAAASVHCCVTSPPYFGLRDYGVAGQIGLEASPEAYVAELVAVFREVRRALRDDGTLWLNLGDSYANDGKWGGSSGGKHARDLHGKTGIGRGRSTTGLKPKDLIGVPWRVAFALQDDGWYLRQDIIWSKPNPMPESVRDRCTKAHEYLFLLSKSARYHFDQDAIAEGLETDPRERYEQRARITGRGDQGAAAARGNDRSKSGVSPPKQRGLPPRHAAYGSSDQSGLDEVARGGRRNKRSVWTVATAPYRGAHFATFPPDLIKPCILAGCPIGGTVLDPFGGVGTTGLVADRLQRNAVLIEINPGYADAARMRISDDAPLLSTLTESTTAP